MLKIKRQTALRIEQILAIISFITLVFFARNGIINSYNRVNDLNTQKTLVILKEKRDSKLLETFDKRSKDDFSNKVDLLISIMFLSFMLFFSIQRRINKEKKCSLLTENPTDKA